MGERFRSIRKAKGMTRRDVAKAIDVTEATLGNWERGKTEPKAHDIIALCKLYGCSADELLGRNG